MKRNAFKGIPVKKATKCNKCGAWFELGNRAPGETCGATHGFKHPFTTCKGKLIPLQRNES